jgi:hypothetical protein
MTEEQLSALLRLKRFEQPPPQYFDQLLQDIHRRQRAELLRRPLWKIAAERIQTFFSEHSMGHLSYAGALASVMIVGVGAIGLMTSGGPAVVRNGGGGQFAKTSTESGKPALDSSRLVNLRIDAPKGRPDLGPHAPLLEPTMSGAGGRRYIIDALPVNYEPSSSIRF